MLNFPQSNLCLKREKQDESCSLTQALPSELKVSADNVSLTGAGKPRINADGDISPATSTGNAGAGVGKDHRFTPVEHLAKFA
ncbi:hypothetical protein VEE68_51660 [Escherichia coli]|nr:hypothetical protein VEE68_51660 [Escherichia coli]